MRDGSLSDLIARAADAAVAHKRLLLESWRVLPALRPAPTKRRMLLLVAEFAPAIAGGVYRPAALARYAARSGWQVAVVTAPPPATPSEAGMRLLEYVGPDVRIERFEPSGLVPGYRLFPQIDGGMLTALDMVDKARNMFGADLPQTVFASGPPFCSFIAGYFLARQPGVRLVVEYRDEWSECPFDFVSKEPANRAWESRCLARADQIVVTTESQKAHLVQTFGASAGAKCVVVANGWEPLESPAILPSAEAHGSRAVLTFAGKLGGHTDPGAFLDALQRVLALRPELRQRICIRFVGAKRSDALRRLQDFPIQEVIELVPVVPLAEATRLMRQSDALLLFHDPRFHRYLPGKLYEYAASATPVLLVDDEGESARLVRDLALGWSVRSHDVEALATVLTKVVERHDRASGPHQPSRALQDWLESHTRERLAHRLLESLPR